MKVCPTPGCPHLVDRSTPCPAGCGARVVRDASRRRRAAQGQQHYDTAAWQRTRTTYRNDHPSCVQCGAPTTDVDHVIPRRILIAAGVSDPDGDSWLQSLCRSCHSAKTQLVDVPLLRRLDAGDDASSLAEEALRST